MNSLKKMEGIIKKFRLKNDINYIVLISVIYYFLFSQHAIAVSYQFKDKILNFGIMPAPVFDKYQNINFGSISKTDYLFKIKQREKDLEIQAKTKTAKILAVKENFKEVKIKIEKIFKPKSVLIETDSIKSNMELNKANLGDLAATESMKVVITAYSSTLDQTDASPFITASGKGVRDGVIAANFLPFGTKVKFPALFGDKEFVVEDRMKSNTKVDIWHSDRLSAEIFGVKRSEMVIVSRPALKKAK